MKRISSLIAASCLLAVGLGASAQTITTVMSGLDNPRGLAFGPEGALYVAEAGRGGSGPSVFLRGAWQRYGPSGAVTRLHKGVQERVVTGLPSMASDDGEAGGPNDVAFQGRGNAYVTISLGADPAARPAFGPPGALFGTLVRFQPNGSWKVVADIAAYEAAVNPDNFLIDSNPYGLLTGPGGVVIAEAGANALVGVRANGALHTIATFPARPARFTDSVPTSVVAGPDGALYVGELTGFPFLEGAANVYRVVPGEAPTVWAAGFKTIIDLAFGADGSLYVLQHATGPFFAGPGQIVRVAPDGGRTVVLGGLMRPTSLVVARDGTVYVTNNGISVGGGEVLKVVF